MPLSYFIDDKNHKKTKIRNIKGYVLLSFFLAFNVFVFFFSTLEIYGYTHQVISSTNPYLFITITESTLFNVLRGSYYSNMLKIAYIINFVFQILSVVSLLIALLISISNKK